MYLTGVGSYEWCGRAVHQMLGTGNSSRECSVDSTSRPLASPVMVYSVPGRRGRVRRHGTLSTLSFTGISFGATTWTVVSPFEPGVAVCFRGT